VGGLGPINGFLNIKLRSSHKPAEYFSSENRQIILPPIFAYYNQTHVPSNLHKNLFFSLVFPSENSKS